MALNDGAPAEAAEETLFEARPALIPSFSTLLAAILTVGIWLIVSWVRKASTRYRASTRRILVDRGLLSTRTDNTELYRVQDLAVERPLGQRLVGTANIVLLTRDTTDPRLVLFALPSQQVEGWFNRLREATEAERTRRGRMVMEQ